MSPTGKKLMKTCFGLLCLSLLLSTTAGCSQRDGIRSGPTQEKAVALPENKTTLPRVLLIGDSISMGYLPHVQRLLKGTAYVEHPPGNCESTMTGLRQLDRWLGGEGWDVIHFNWGLHDLKYVDSEGRKVAVSVGTQKVTVEQYEKNLQELVIRLKRTGAKLVFATTTPVPEGARGRVRGDAARYNSVAVEIMKKHSIRVNDLYGLAMERLGDVQRPRNVHFTEPQGYEFLARQVAAEIQNVLRERQQAN
ncbi:MAG: SGNH/GDSL hydrolase family protein [Planctomycetota bacterium]